MRIVPAVLLVLLTIRFGEVFRGTEGAVTPMAATQGMCTVGIDLAGIGLPLL